MLTVVGEFGCLPFEVSGLVLETIALLSCFSTFHWSSCTKAQEDVELKLAESCFAKIPQQLILQLVALARVSPLCQLYVQAAIERVPCLVGGKEADERVFESNKKSGWSCCMSFLHYLLPSPAPVSCCAFCTAAIFFLASCVLGHSEERQATVAKVKEHFEQMGERNVFSYDILSAFYAQV